MDAVIKEVTKEGIVVLVEYKYTWKQLENATQNTVAWLKLFAKGKELLQNEQQHQSS